MKLPIEGRWLALIALIAGGFVGALMLAVRFVRLPEPVKPTLPRITSGIGLAPTGVSVEGATLREQALLDPDPLFLPTGYNASQPKLPELIRREPGTAFQPVLPNYTYTPAIAEITFPDVVTVPAKPVDSLTYGHLQSPYEVLGRFGKEEIPLSPRLAMIEVVQMRTGRVVLSAPVIPQDTPPFFSSADWAPLELLAAVDRTGLIGLPGLSRGSGVESVDSFFRSYLAKQFYLGERLPPGFYTVRVGP